MLGSVIRRSLATEMKDLHEAKKALRNKMKAVVAGISESDKDLQSKIVSEKVLQTEDYKNAKTISLYLHMYDEVRTEEIMKTALLDGKKVYIPKYFMGGNLMEMVRLYGVEDYKQLPETKWKIKQPSDDDKRPEALEEGSLDLMFIPGMAFTQQGHRLGRGKGYYDTYLAKAQSKGLSPKTIALAFNEQVVPSVPCDDHDFLIRTVMYADRK